MEYIKKHHNTVNKPVGQSCNRKIEHHLQINIPDNNMTIPVTNVTLMTIFQIPTTPNSILHKK